MEGPIKEYSWSWESVSYKLFAKFAPGQDIFGYLPDLDDVGEFNPAPRTLTVGSHTRRLYPGGPQITVGGHSRTTLLGGRANRRTLPGNNAFFERLQDGLSGQVIEVVTVSHTGPFTALYQYCLNTTASEFRLRSQDGTTYLIGLSGDGPED
jgi:hypothetical protein